LAKIRREIWSLCIPLPVCRNLEIVEKVIYQENSVQNMFLIAAVIYARKAE
jgi:hypothetical protein